MPGNLQPLDQKFALVKPDGTPTDYFIRWAQQRQIDITNGIDAAQALAIIEQFTADHPLIAGSGITLTPSGDIADDVTIAAEVQAILDQISSTQGTVLFRGAADWQGLAPGTSGHFLKTNGAGADPEWAAASGGGGSWSLVDQSGAPIASGTTWSHSVNVANVDVVGLGGYTDLLIVARGLVSSTSGNRNILVSTDNGSSFFSSSGDYVSLSDAGVETNAATMLIHDIATTSARSLLGSILGSGVTGGPKIGLGPGSGGNRQRLFVADTDPISALRLVPGGGGNLTAGDLYVFAR